MEKQGSFCSSTKEVLGDLRDKKDIPVLSDALFHNIDVILTGDKDFLEAYLEHPLIFSPAMMYDFLLTIMTLSDETEIVHSHLFEENGEKKVIVPPTKYWPTATLKLLTKIQFLH